LKFRGFQIHRDLLNSFEWYRLKPKEAVKAFYQAANGEGGPIAHLVKPWNCRPPANEWRVLRTAVFARDNYTCTYCGERGKKLECDHIIPVAKGGSHDLGNLTTACKACNQSKRDKTLEEWRADREVA